ncbi:MAG: flavodoxin domain-containing protein, partial [Caulobacteraceae bacterium]
AETGWKPAAVHHVAGAFRFTQYDFFKRMMMKKIAREKGVNVDAKHDLELTDWDDLVRFVDGFAGA